MIEPPLHPDEALRLSSLYATELLDTAPDPRLDWFTDAVCELLDVPTALVSLVDVDRQWFKSARGLDASETSRAISFCGHAILGSEVFVVGDATQDPRFADNPLVTGDLGLRAYIGRPLKGPGALPVGTLCALDYEPRDYEPEAVQRLDTLAAELEWELLGGTAPLVPGRFSASSGVVNELTGLWAGDVSLRLCREALSQLAGGNTAAVVMVRLRPTERRLRLPIDQVSLQLAARLRRLAPRAMTMGHLWYDTLFLVFHDHTERELEMLEDRLRDGLDGWQSTLFRDRTARAPQAIPVTWEVSVGTYRTMADFDRAFLCLG